MEARASLLGHSVFFGIEKIGTDTLQYCECNAVNFVFEKQRQQNDDKANNNK